MEVGSLCILARAMKKDANDQNRVVEGEEARAKGSPLGGEV